MPSQVGMAAMQRTDDSVRRMALEGVDFDSDLTGLVRSVPFRSVAWCCVALRALLFLFCCCRGCVLGVSSGSCCCPPCTCARGLMLG